MRCRGAHQHYRLRGCGIFLQPFLCSVYGMGTSIINSRWGAFWRPTLFLLRPRTSATPRRASTTLRARSRATPRRASTNSRTRSRSRTAAPHHVPPVPASRTATPRRASPNSRTCSRTLRVTCHPHPFPHAPHAPNAQPHPFPFPTFPVPAPLNRCSAAQFCRQRPLRVLTCATASTAL